jgi:hypothetical protein
VENTKNDYAIVVSDMICNAIMAVEKNSDIPVLFDSVYLAGLGERQKLLSSLVNPKDAKNAK